MTLQQRRRDELIAKIERTVARRERVLADLCRMTKSIATMAKQLRRYELVLSAFVPKPAVPVEERRPASEVLKRPTKRTRG